MKLIGKLIQSGSAGFQDFFCKTCLTLIACSFLASIISFLSAADPLLDKKGRRMCDYIQLYCRCFSGPCARGERGGKSGGGGSQGGLPRGAPKGGSHEVAGVCMAAEAGCNAPDLSEVLFLATSLCHSAMRRWRFPLGASSAAVCVSSGARSPGTGRSAGE